MGQFIMYEIRRAETWPFLVGMAAAMWMGISINMGITGTFFSSRRHNVRRRGRQEGVQVLQAVHPRRPIGTLDDATKDIPTKKNTLPSVASTLLDHFSTQRTIPNYLDRDFFFFVPVASSGRPSKKDGLLN